ncbi:MAG: hypothetical protein JSS02_27785 [Planctomycetes bacterium]|nr:hypothetical protein [Planctomycetota bacterium]
MTRENRIWTVLFICGGLFLLYRGFATEHGLGRTYVKSVRVDPESTTDLRMTFEEARPTTPGAQVSWPRTAGLWLAAFFTLAVLSFLYRDNVFYRLAESVMVGVSAAWYMVTAGFWDGIVPKLLGKLCPYRIRDWATIEPIPEMEPNYVYLAPLVLGLMLLCRLSPRIGWIGRWPLAFIVGIFAGIKLISFLDADFVNQIRSTIIPLIVMTESHQFNLWASLRNFGLVFGLLSCLTYFFFSVEHRGVVGVLSRVGIWYLMITFGASFAFTVMGRIALLAGRVTFLFDDWLWLIDPAGKRPWGP